MTQENHIVDTQLPLELDFQALKAAGLAYIQQHSGTAWTNLNPSDPGVTILEQLCYAFTELGYCANFPMKDILTLKNGDLQMENQFYTPKNILTTSPVTIDDYTKFIIDRIIEVKNVIIQPITVTIPIIENAYQTYLLLDTKYSDTTTPDLVISDAFYLLNSARNVGELFLKPKILLEKKYTITGNLELASGYHYDDVLPEIIQAITQYIFPDVMQTGYNALEAEGESSNDIFNGPILNNGWIPTESIQPKKDSIQPFEITKLIQNIKGVAAINKLAFYYNNIPQPTATCSEDEILVFDIPTSLVSTNTLQIHSDGKLHNLDINASLLEEFGNMQQLSSKINTVAAVAIEPSLPEGRYRDITNYYAIQNTFPEAYKVGLNAVNDNTPTYQVAQSRQLKGYLNLFDQMLSNQFAQLANINKLFSFKNTNTGNPADLENYYATKSKEEKENQKYPVPFEVFSPTYFYQSLYKSVPNVQPLLSNNSIFKFGSISETEDALTKKNWNSYQEDPYNSYMYGLLLATEDDTINLNRRNDLLDHLLARHGESPMIIDTIIYGTIYSGNVLKDRVIIKSLYLQNLGILSYNKIKAYNVIGGVIISSDLTKITSEVIRDLIQNKDPESLTKELRVLQDILLQSNEREAIFDSNRLDAIEKVTNQDCIEYTTITLKLGLLLALRQHYVDYLKVYNGFDYFYDKGFYLKSLYLTEVESLQKSMALWLITAQKGLISIETNVLLQSANFEFYIKHQPTPSELIECYRNTSIINYFDFVSLTTLLNTEKTKSKKTAEIKSLIENKSDTTWATTELKEGLNYTPIGDTDYSWAVQVSWDTEFTTTLNHPVFEETMLLFFPDYIATINNAEYKQRLSYFMDSQLPIHISAFPMHITTKELYILIPLFSDWHNALLYDGTEESFDTTKSSKATGKLLKYVETLYTKYNTNE